MLLDRPLRLIGLVVATRGSWGDGEFLQHLNKVHLMCCGSDVPGARSDRLLLERCHAVLGATHRSNTQIYAAALRDSPTHGRTLIDLQLVAILNRVMRPGTTRGDLRLREP